MINIKLDKVNHDDYFKQMESMFDIKLYWYQKLILKMMLFKNEKRILPVRKVRGFRQSLNVVDEHCDMEIERKLEVLRKAGLNVRVLDKNAPYEDGYILGKMKDSHPHKVTEL